ncbi:M16 family metallopeptidase [Alkalinema pantanalense CENA528]|uniref:M16 family metallopeptidase n=1 Tax=Alkalinema pantanalense TaxID=1620705 RepID=UPI003D6E2E86
MDRLRRSITRLLALLSIGIIWFGTVFVGQAWAETASVPQASIPQAIPVQPKPAPGKATQLKQSQSIQPYLDRVIRNITEFTLDNGMKFIVLERHDAPVVSFLTYADVGGADEVAGKTGISHFLEHLAFKGTTRIGTQDFAKEKVLLAQEDALWSKIQTTKARTEAAQLQAEFDRVEAQAAALVEQNEYGQIVEQAGGVGLNANTSAEATRYFYSFPANKLELWMSLESERFLDPVFREFFKEKAVILEERRLRTDNSPIGKLIEEFLLTAFKVHPYRQPVVGFEADLRRMSRQDVYDFYKLHYVPENLTFAIVGDVDPIKVKQLAQTYFGRFAKRPAPNQTLPAEPPQQETRQVSLTLNSQPIYLEGYHRPALSHPDNAVYESIASLLSNGRTSRLYKSLVEEKKLALTAEGFNGFPGDKYPNLIMFYALTAPGHTLEEVQQGLQTEIERLKTQSVDQAELDRVKTQARAGLLRSLDSNSGMAEALLEYEVKTGSWRNLFKQVDAIAAVTPADIQRVAQTTFTPKNRTIGRVLSKD